MKTKNIKEKIKKYFFSNPTIKLRVRQIERELKLPLPSVIRYCRELEKEKIIKKENAAGVVLFSADRSSNTFLVEKRLFNLGLLLKCELMNYIIAEYSNPTIVLFGSFSKGEDTEGSDIDLYIETPSKKGIKLGKFEKMLKRRIQIFRYSNINDVANIHLANNIINGIAINGFLEVFK